MMLPQAVLEAVARVASSALGCANPLSARFPRNHSAARRHTTRTLLCMRCRAQCIGDALSFTEAPSHRSLPAAATTLLVRCDCGSAGAEMMSSLSRCREWQFCFLCPRDVARGCSLAYCGGLHAMCGHGRGRGSRDTAEAALRY